MLEPWVAQVEKNSGGRVKIDIFPSMTLGGAPPQLINQVRDGVVDLVWTVNGYTAALFPRSEVFELPFIHTNNPGATSRAMYDMFRTISLRSTVAWKSCSCMCMPARPSIWSTSWCARRRTSRA